MQHDKEFHSPFPALLSSTTTTPYFHCGILLPLRIVHVALFPFTPSIGCLSFLSCSYWQCTFSIWVQVLQSQPRPPYSMLHTLLNCNSPSRWSPWHMPDLVLHHFLVCSLSTHDLGWSPQYLVMSFLGFAIHLFKFFLCPLYYSNSISDCWDSPHINSLENIS